MGNERLCVYCQHSDKNRKNGENIRCTLFSCWVNPCGKACEKYREKHGNVLGREPFSEALSREDIVASAILTHKRRDTDG